MWYCKDINELIKIKKEYEEITGYDPDGEMDLEYDDKTYKRYVKDLRQAIKRKVTIADLYD